MGALGKALMKNVYIAIANATINELSLLKK